MISPKAPSFFRLKIILRKLSAFGFGLFLLLLIFSLTNLAGRGKKYVETCSKDEIAQNLQSGFTSKRCVKNHERDLLYDIVYTTDPMGRRYTPDDEDDTAETALFFGCSFVYGAGVDDRDTLPSKVAKRISGVRVLNYGVCGSGPHEMLDVLQSEKIKVDTSGPYRFCVYVFIDPHVNRAIGRASDLFSSGDRGAAPYYDFSADGRLIKRGTLALKSQSLPYRLIHFNFPANRKRYFPIDWPLRITDRHEELTAKIIIEASNVFKDRFGSSKFVVVFYPARSHYPKIVRDVQNAGVKVFDYSKLFPLTNEYFIKNDGHPTARANEIVAERLVGDLRSLGAVP